MGARSILRTGNNDPVNTGILEKTKRYLVDVHGCWPVREIKDTGGVYAHCLCALQGQRFYLVAKASDLGRPPEFGGVKVVSVQKALIRLAKENELPIILAWWQKAWSDPMLLMFHPDEIETLKLSDDPTNRRFKEVMYNFDFNLGDQIYHLRVLRSRWFVKRMFWRDERSRVLNQESLSRFL